jgi:hypothetical protein
MFTKTESRPQAAYLIEAEPRARCPTGDVPRSRSVILPQISSPPHAPRAQLTHAANGADGALIPASVAETK